jgi:hypothetical protein
MKSLLGAAATRRTGERFHDGALAHPSSGPPELFFASISVPARGWLSHHPAGATLPPCPGERVPPAFRMEATMEPLHGPAVSSLPAAQLAIDLGAHAERSDPLLVREAAAGGYAAWNTEEIVGLHFILLDDLRRLADPATPLEERFELLEWVFTDRARASEPFSFGMCVRLFGRTCDPDGVREALRPLSLAWLRDAVAPLPAWLGEQILREPQWAAAELHRNPQRLNEELLRHAREPDLFGGLPDRVPG